MRFLLLLLLAGCGTTECVTRCGLKVYNMPYNWSCSDFQDREVAAFRAFTRTKDKRLLACKKLRGYTLYLKGTENWHDHGRTVSGLTLCTEKAIFIGSSAITRGAMVHEMAHALQNCEPREPVDVNDYYHSNWDRDQIYEAIETARDT